MASVEANGITLHYDSLGPGAGEDSGRPALVLAHAFPTSRIIWRPQMAALSAGRRVVAYDFRGFGASDAPQDPEAYSQAIFVADLLGLIDALELDRVVVCGLSMGGNIALHFALGHPERLAGLVLADTGSGSDDREAFRRKTAAWAAVARAEGMAGFARQAREDPMFGRYADPAAPGHALLTQAILGNRAHGIANAAERVLGPRLPVFALEERLRALAVPTLVSTGALDEPCLAPSRFMSETIPGARLAVIPETGHFNNLEAPEAFNAALEDFLEGLG